MGGAAAAVVVVAAVAAVMAGAARADTCDRRDRRTHTTAWKGDIGDLEVFPGGTVKDGLQVRHPRVRRFISFPTGSVFSVIPKFIIPFYSRFDGYIVGSQLYSVVLDLRLPNSTLMLRPRRPEGQVAGATWGAPHYAAHATYRAAHATTGAALDHNRMAGFTFLQQMMDSVGLEGRACVLRAVCEVAEDPVTDLGLMGEIVNMFFSAGYGSRARELEDYIAAEESGRREGGCEAQYPACPCSLLDVFTSVSSFFHRGLAGAGEAAAQHL
nr:uncharacterized protein LOC123756053 [Procambarus clarkii]